MTFQEENNLRKHAAQITQRLDSKPLSYWQENSDEYQRFDNTRVWIAKRIRISRLAEMDDIEISKAICQETDNMRRGLSTPEESARRIWRFALCRKSPLFRSLTSV